MFVKFGGSDDTEAAPLRSASFVRGRSWMNHDRKLGKFVSLALGFGDNEIFAGETA